METGGVDGEMLEGYTPAGIPCLISCGAADIFMVSDTSMSSDTTTPTLCKEVFQPLEPHLAR